MLSSWGSALSLAVLILNVSHAKAGSTHFVMEYQQTPPISTRLLTSGLQSEVSVGSHCVVCSNTSQPSAFDFASGRYSRYDDDWLGFALDSFETSFEIEVDLSEDANDNVTLSLMKIPAGFDGVAVEVDFQLFLVADASASMSFTTGLNLTLKEPAAIMMPASFPSVSLDKSKAIGFTADNFILAPIFNATMPQLDFSVQLSLRTVFSVTFETVDIGALYLDLPAFKLEVNTLTNAMSDCQPPPAGTPSDEIYADLIHVTGGFVAELSYEILGGEEAGSIDQWPLGEAYEKCYAFFPGLGFIGPPPSSSKSALLTAPAITTCTTGGTTNSTGTADIGAALKSLSPGAKAGAVIGTLIGVTLVAALSWSMGRASVHHSTKNGGTGFASTIPRPRSGAFFSRSGKFFHRVKRGGATKFAPVTPTVQTPMYEGGYFPSSSTDVQQGWQMSQKEPFVNTNEVVTPAPTYVAIGDEYSIPTPSAEETGAMREDTEWQSLKYEDVRSGQAEGLGLLEGGDRPVIQRKEIPRKPLP